MTFLCSYARSNARSNARSSKTFEKESDEETKRRFNYFLDKVITEGSARVLKTKLLANGLVLILILRTGLQDTGLARQRHFHKVEGRRTGAYSLG